MITYEPDTRTKIIIQHTAGTNEEVKIRDSMVELANQDEPLIDILEKTDSIEKELEALQDQYYHAGELLGNIKALIDKLPRRPIKKDLVAFIEDIQAEIENSYYEF